MSLAVCLNKQAKIGHLNSLKPRSFIFWEKIETTVTNSNMAKQLIGN